MVNTMTSGNVALGSLLLAASIAAFTVAGCGGQDSSTPAPDESTLDPSLSEEATDSDDATTPANDDPAIGAVVEDPLDPDYHEVDVDLDIPEVWEIDALQRPVRVKSPVPGKRITYPYGVKNSRYAAGYHTGDDYATPRGSKVVAVRAGRIRWSNDAGGAYGKWMGLDADNGRTYVYCHLSKRLYGAGKHVKAGQLIARSGATGNVTGPHLHFEDHPHGAFHYAQDRRPRW